MHLYYIIPLKLEAPFRLTCENQYQPVHSPQNSSLSRFFLFISLEAKMSQEVLSYSYKD